MNYPPVDALEKLAFHPDPTPPRLDLDPVTATDIELGRCFRVDLDQRIGVPALIGIDLAVFSISRYSLASSGLLTGFSKLSS